MSDVFSLSEEEAANPQAFDKVGEDGSRACQCGGGGGPSRGDGDWAYEPHSLESCGVGGSDGGGGGASSAMVLRRLIKRCSTPDGSSCGQFNSSSENAPSSI